MSEKRWPNCETADDWVAELDRRMDADPNVELAPVAVGIMRTTQIIHEAMQAAEERGRRRVVEECGMLHRLALAVKHAKAEGVTRPCESTRTAWRVAEQRLITAANALPDLAPRDSAPTIPSVASHGCPECSKPQPGDLGMGSIEARQLRCPHKPRDSGKEG